MKSQTITSGRLQKATAAWIHGMNSVRNPWTLPEDQYKFGQNITCRGGIVQTRNGFKMKLSLPAGNFQGGIIYNANKQYKAASTFTNLTGNVITQKQTIYTPEGTESEDIETPYAIFCVDGNVYYAPFPLKQPKTWNDYRLTNISLDPSVDKVNFVIATQSASINSGGSTNVTPSHRIVIIQDNINTPVYWDGSNKTGVKAVDMPIGYWMAYSGNRLWVANGNIISASDLANPIGWEERKKGAGRGDFSVPRPVTALHDYVGQNNDTRLYVFTDQSTYSLASGIIDRDQWSTTANFQSILFPNIGCVAGDSIAFISGLMWWYSKGGLVSADVASASYLSSQVLYKDIEMAKVKRFMSSNCSGVCSVAFENYLLISVPYLERLNSATMVLDYAAASEWNQSRSPAWAGVWNGIRPVAWATNIINNESRCFAFSVDYSSTSDGSHNHLWEAFVPERYDTYLDVAQDGSTTERINRIYCQLETALLGDGMDLKQFAYGELDCSQIAGVVDVKVSYRGSRGSYQSILDTRILAATEPYQYATSNYADEIDQLGILQTQARRLITESKSRNVSVQSCESKYTLDVDKAFSFLVEWCGAFGVDAIRMFQDPWSEQSVGKTTQNETAYCVIGENGESLTIELEGSPKEQVGNSLNSWYATQTRTITLRCGYGDTPAVSATATASYTSYISPEDARLQAAALATQQATTAANQYRSTHPC
jgi:hypothetical protein